MSAVFRILMQMLIFITSIYTSEATGTCQFGNTGCIAICIAQNYIGGYCPYGVNGPCICAGYRVTPPAPPSQTIGN